MCIHYFLGLRHARTIHIAYHNNLSVRLFEIGTEIMVRPVGAYADEPDRYLVARRIHAKQFGSCKGRGYSRYQGGLNKGTTSEVDPFHNDSA